MLKLFEMETIFNNFRIIKCFIFIYRIHEIFLLTSDISYEIKKKLTKDKYVDLHFNRCFIVLTLSVSFFPTKYPIFHNY